ncbi:hypothetical protein QTP70_015701 [Hemibagrus guttatus]|uniref:Uncharacterized protein n=1 Tax=Hemibagrus guttatus TaxID=175788 RepID=A0AAE0UKJ4_9TELE|nr:hypothetical protein QTP70_015701 [Hemibagrus guttatus]
MAADNRGAPSLADFYENFTVEKFCRFCMASRSDAQHLQENKSFKKVIRDAQNFKNVAMALAVKHQKALSHQLDCSAFLSKLWK